MFVVVFVPSSRRGDGVRLDLRCRFPSRAFTLDSFCVFVLTLRSERVGERRHAAEHAQRHEQRTQRRVVDDDQGAPVW